MFLQTHGKSSANLIGSMEDFAYFKETQCVRSESSNVETKEHYLLVCTVVLLYFKRVKQKFRKLLKV